MYLGIIGNKDRECFEKAAARGLDALEFDINDNWAVDEYVAAIPEINALIKETGVRVGAVGQWGPQRIFPDGSINYEQLEIEKKLISFAEAVGCHVYITGCNWTDGKSIRENCEFAASYIGLLVEEGKKHGVKVCIYNCDWNSFVDRDPQWGIILDMLPDLGIKYDPSHAIEHGRDYKAEIRRWAHRFYHFHVKGTMHMDNGEFDFPPAGLDETDWRWVLGYLYSSRYTGMISIEPHSPVWQGELGEKGIDYTVSYLKPMIFEN